MIDVFISYSSKDKHIADAVCHELEENRIKCWIAPRDVLAGMAYARQIIHAIKDCEILILIFSSSANESQHVSNEIDQGFKANKPIIPFVIEESNVNDELDYYLSRKHWLVAYPDYKQKTETLIKTVLQLLGRKINNVEDGPDCGPVKMVKVEGGTFTMGATIEQGKDAFDSEKPKHNVTLDSFFISHYCKAIS